MLNILSGSVNSNCSVYVLYARIAAKVLKYLKDRKINSIDKFNKLVLVNGDDKIIWVVGMRLDRRFSVSDGSKKIIDASGLQIFSASSFSNVTERIKEVLK